MFQQFHSLPLPFQEWVSGRASKNKLDDLNTSADPAADAFCLPADYDTPADKEQMKSMGIARVAADDVETLLGMTRSEQAEAGIKTEAWEPGKPVRIWKLGD